MLTKQKTVDAISYTATYRWRYGSKLKVAESNFPGEGDVGYMYDGLGKRRFRQTDVESANIDTWYRWDAGWGCNAEYANDAGDFWDMGNRERGFVMPGMIPLADVAGTNPATGDYRYYAQDHLGSTRSLFDASKDPVSSVDYTPYGNQTVSGEDVPLTFTGKPYEAETGQYYFPFRYYAPGLGRWMSRDPLGMQDGPNTHIYSLANAANHIDRYGLTIYVCMRGTSGGVGNHAYFWNSKDASACGMNNSCGKDSGSDHDQDEVGPGAEGTTCKPIEGSDGYEDELMKCCDKIANRGPWIPGLNDCHSKLKRCIRKANKAHEDDDDFDPIGWPDDLPGRLRCGAR